METRHSAVGIIAIATLSNALVSYDAAVVGVALPKIDSRLSIPIASGGWVSGAMLLVIGATVVPAGRLSGRYGPRIVLFWGTLIIMLGTVLAAIAQEAAMLLAGRAIQGLGSSALLAAGMMIVGVCFEPDRRSTVFGISVGLSAVMFVAGPVVGGLLTDGPGWRAIFVTELPVAIVLLLTIVIWAPKKASVVDPLTPKHGLDIGGAVLLAIATTGVAFAATQFGATASLTPVIIVSFIVGIGAGVVFVRFESRDRFPMVPVRDVWRNLELRSLLFYMLILRLALVGPATYLVLYFELGLGESATAAGLSLLPALLPAFIAAPLAGYLSDRLGYAPILLASAVLVVCGLATGAAAIGTSSRSLMVAGLILFGLGIASSVSPNTAACLNAVHASELGMVSGLSRMVSQFGGLLGLAVFGALIGGVEAIVAGVNQVVPPQAIAPLDPSEKTGLDDGLIVAMTLLALAVVWVTVIMWRHRDEVTPEPAIDPVS